MYQGEVHLEYNLDPVLPYVFVDLGVTNLDRTSHLGHRFGFQLLAGRYWR